MSDSEDKTQKSCKNSKKKENKPKIEKTKKEEVAWKSPPDKIPGYTTYLYQENRFRKPSEFIGYTETHPTDQWKDLDCSEEILNHLKSGGNLDEFLINELYRLENDNKDITDSLHSSIFQAREEEAKKHLVKIEELRDKLNLLQSEVSDLKYETARQQVNIIDYGDHKPDCDILEIASIGRIGIKGRCTCGWEDLKEKINPPE